MQDQADTNDLVPQCQQNNATLPLSVLTTTCVEYYTGHLLAMK